MSAPKSVVKVISNKTGCHVEYTSNCDQSQYYLHELNRAALRDVGKYVLKKFKTNFYENFQKHTGKAPKSTKYAVFASAKTEHPRVQIGYKKGQTDGFYAYFQEIGARDGLIPRLQLLENSVKDNVAEIVKIESQYLSGLEDEASRLEQMIDEKDMEGSGDDE